MDHIFNFHMNLPNFYIAIMMNNMTFIINLALKLGGRFLHLMFLTDKILLNKKSEKHRAIF